MKRRSSFCFSMLSVLFISCIPASLMGQTLAVTLSYPPLVISPDNATTDKGLCTELVKEAARRAGVNLTIKVVPWARAYETAKSKVNTLIFPLIKSADRDKLFEWIGPVNRPLFTVYRVRSPGLPPIHDFTKIGNATIGVVNSAADHLYLKAQNIVKIDAAVSLEVLVNKLMAGRNQYIVAQNSALVYELKHRGTDLSLVEALFTLNDVIPDGYSYLALAKGSSPALITSLRSALAAMRTDGTWERIYDAWQH